MIQVRIGIDNGAKGAIVALRYVDGVARGVLAAIEMPVLNVGVTRRGKRGTKNVLNMRAVHDALAAISEAQGTGGDVFAVLEHAQVFPGEGRSTAFTAGRGYGALEMALVALSIPYEIVRPMKWQKAILTGTEGADTKAKSVLKIQRALPSLDLTPGKKRKPHDGLSDAACMALYATSLLPLAQPARNRQKRPPP